MQSSVLLILSDNSQKCLGPTGSDGVLTLEPAEPCMQGMVLRARPGSAHYQEASKYLECGDSQEVMLLRRIHYEETSLETDNLRKNIEYAVAANDPALEALLYNDLAARSTDSDRSNDYAERAVLAWAAATDFCGDPVAPVGGNKLTYQFAAHVEQQQQLMGLKVTGQLDYLTFAKTANRDVSWFLYDVQPNLAEVPAMGQRIQCAKLTSREVNRENLPELITALVDAAEQRESAGEYGNAALLFNEAHARVRDDPVAMAYIEPRVYENVGRELGVPNPIQCDPIQARFVMTPAMVETVKAHQQEQATGILDYETIRGFADIDVGPFLAR